MKAVIKLLIFIFHLKLLVADETCNDFEKCGTCIGFAGDKCVWCSEVNITDRRCQSEKFYKSNRKWCKNESVFNPAMIELVTLRNDSLRSGKDSKAIQLRPQRMTVKLRPGVPYKFKMYYQPAEDFPLDLYYLCDYTYTMKSHVNELKKQVQSVYDELVGFTNNVRFGIGSFVEKPDFPFVDTELHTAYSFRNHLSLTKNMTLVKDAFTASLTGSNYDLPEAGLDALMQVMACDKVIDWRPNARRIIILFTDATYHSAGDGKMVGAISPNDMKCHLDESNTYNYSLIQDYPSVSQINKMATDGNFMIIFAALSQVSKEYETLAEQISGAKYAELKDNSNIVEFIKSIYLKSLRHVTFNHQWPPFVSLQLNPDCTRNDICEIKHKQPLEIAATMKVNFCPNKGEPLSHSLNVKPGGTEENLQIKLEVICECDCEKVTEVNKSLLCKSFGVLQCGICKCDENRYGESCQCSGNLSNKADLEKCKLNNNDTSFCNGRGTCFCGMCQCNKDYSGKFCEFDDTSCQRRNNKLCSGNGRCTWGACVCGPQWSGDDCSCFEDKQVCLAPYSKEICSGNGDCICGECVCRKIKDKEEVYSGLFCEDCEDCTKKRCKELEDYAYCNYLNNKTYCDQLEQYNQTSSTEVLKLNKTEIIASKWPTAKWCQKDLEGDIHMVFLYNFDKSNKKLQLIIQKELEEPTKANIWVPVGIAIGTVLLIGILTVVGWKILVDKMDEKEYNRFMQDAQNAGFDVTNPIYQPAATEFSNPTYNNAQ